MIEYLNLHELSSITPDEIVGNWKNGESTLNFEVGDIIQGYYKGYYVVTAIQERSPELVQYTYSNGVTRVVLYLNSPIVSMVLFAHSNGVKVKTKNPKTVCCDSLYCGKVTTERLYSEMRAKLEEIDNQYASLINIVGEHYGTNRS